MSRQSSGKMKKKLDSVHNLLAYICWTKSRDVPKWLEIKSCFFLFFTFSFSNFACLCYICVIFYLEWMCKWECAFHIWGTPKGFSYCYCHNYHYNLNETKILWIKILISKIKEKTANKKEKPFRIWPAPPW